MRNWLENRAARHRGNSRLPVPLQNCTQVWNCKARLRKTLFQNGLRIFMALYLIYARGINSCSSSRVCGKELFSRRDGQGRVFPASGCSLAASTFSASNSTGQDLRCIKRFRNKEKELCTLSHSSLTCHLRVLQQLLEHDASSALFLEFRCHSRFSQGMAKECTRSNIVGVS